MLVRVEATEVWPVLSLERVEREDHSTPPPGDLAYVPGSLIHRRERLQEELRVVERKILEEALGSGLDRETEGIDALAEVYGL